MTLLSRLQSLTGPDREVDAEIARLILPKLRSCPRDDHGDQPGWMTEDGRVYAPHYTASVDAALPLAPVLDAPGQALWIRLEQGVGGNGTVGCMWRATIWGVIDDWEPEWHGLHQFPAIALLIAIMQAKETINQETANER